MNHYWILAVIILLAGLLGGLINYVENYSKNENEKLLAFFRYILWGVGAAVLVPLFLRTISSTLVELPAESADKEVSVDPYKYFVFAGFCLIASIFSKRFIQTLGDKILKEVEEVKERTKANSDTIESLVAVDAEEDDEEQGGRSGMQQLRQADPVRAQDAANVIKEMSDNRYRFRSISGIAAKAGVTRDQTAELLEELESKNLVRKLKGGKYWALTGYGRAAARNL